MRLSSKEKDWRLTVGMFPDDEMSREAESLGREWREQANRDALGAVWDVGVP